MSQSIFIHTCRFLSVSRRLNKHCINISGRIIFWQTMWRQLYGQRQITVTACFTSKQLLLFIFARWLVCQYLLQEDNPAVQRQIALTTYFTSYQLLLFVFDVGIYQQRQWLLTLQVIRYLCLSLHSGQHAITRWQKRILQLKDKQQ